MLANKDKKRVLIFIVAYNAAEHIEKVLERIPEKFFITHDYEILIIDDSSKDNTYETADRYRSKKKKLNITVLHNPENLGYGGNQKLGYHYAVKNNFDFVVLLHGDGQYAPEMINEILEPLLNSTADIVIGSRMLKNKGALTGGMPLYKYIGNKILTGIQNFLLKTELSEFHSGYRAYSVKFLKSVPFERNTDNFHFDTEILIQGIIGNYCLKEISIPTFYGNEICHVNGIFYAWNVVKTTFAAKAFFWSVYYQRKYDLEKGNSNEHYTLKLGYISSHSMALDAVEENSEVLEIGCSQGYLLKELKKKNCRCIGTDKYSIKNSNEIDIFKLYDADKDKFPFKNLKDTDYILILDVIEHLMNADKILEILREKSVEKKPELIITTGNIAFIIMRIQLLLGNFNYGKKGILDMTHRRLYTFNSLSKLLEGCGYKIIKTKGIPVPFPKVFGLNKLSRFLLMINSLLIKIHRGLFSYQIYIKARPLPTVSELLSCSISESGKK